MSRFSWGSIRGSPCVRESRPLSETMCSGGRALPYLSLALQLVLISGQQELLDDGNVDFEIKPSSLLDPRLRFFLPDRVHYLGKGKHVAAGREYKIVDGTVWRKKASSQYPW